MKYLCLAYGDRKKMETLTKAEFEALVAKCKVHDEELHRSGHFVSSNSLEWDTVAIRPRGGKPVTTDGPFVETKEQVGGYYILEVDSEEEAVALAHEMPRSPGLVVEVLPTSAV